MPRLLHPRLLGFHLLALILTGAAVWLGLWQYDAWSARRAAEARDLTRLEPIPLAEAMGPDDPFPPDKVGHPVRVTGTWVPDGTVYVSGREHQGREGFWAVTPLAVAAPEGPALLVVRGWTPEPEAAPEPPTGTAELVAWLQPAEGTGEVDPDPTDDVLPQVRIADAIQHLDQDLYGGYGVATEPVGSLEPATLEQLPDAGTFTALRNLLYAAEWWFFGAFVVFIWWRWVREDVLGDGTDESADQAADQTADQGARDGGDIAADAGHPPGAG